MTHKKMAHQNRRISIITPLHNKGPYIADTISSVISQTITDWEMLVVENGSTDNGPEVVKQFTDSRISMVTSPVNGPGAARNYGLSLAAGEWVLFLDADDLLEPCYLQNKLDVIQANQGADIVAGCWKEFVNNRPDEFILREPVGFQSSLAVVLESAIAFTPWILHAAMIRREWISQDRIWATDLDGMPSEDASFWFCLLLGAHLAWSNDSDALYRTGLTSSRESLAGCEARSRAVREVVNHNIRFIKSRAMEPSPSQCAILTRVFEQSYRKALQGGDRLTAAEVIKDANFWLKKSPSTSIPIILRKILGLKTFNFLNYGLW